MSFLITLSLCHLLFHCWLPTPGSPSGLVEQLKCCRCHCWTSPQLLWAHPGPNDEHNSQNNHELLKETAMSISICVCPVSLHRSVLLYSQSWRNKGLLADLFTRVHNYTYKISLSWSGLILTSHVELEAIVHMSLFARKLIHWKICAERPEEQHELSLNLVGVKM